MRLHVASLRGHALDEQQAREGERNQQSVRRVERRQHRQAARGFACPSATTAQPNARSRRSAGCDRTRCGDSEQQALAAHQDEAGAAVESTSSGASGAALVTRAAARADLGQRARWRTARVRRPTPARLRASPSNTSSVKRSTRTASAIGAQRRFLARQRRTAVSPRRRRVVLAVPDDAIEVAAVHRSSDFPAQKRFGFLDLAARIGETSSEKWRPPLDRTGGTARRSNARPRSPTKYKVGWRSGRRTLVLARVSTRPPARQRGLQASIESL